MSLTDRPKPGHSRVPPEAAATPTAGWRHALAAVARRRSLKRQLVLMFVLLAAAAASVFVLGAQRAFSVGWRDAARPLVADYVDRLAAEVLGPDGGPPQIHRARELAERLPVTVGIRGPLVQWDSHPRSPGVGHGDDDAQRPDADLAPPPAGSWSDTPHWAERRSADGHRIRFGLQRPSLERHPGWFGGTVLALLALSAGAYAYVRRLLQPLDAIGAGVQRFGAGDFGQAIPLRHPNRPDELDQLAGAVNTMAGDIAQLLDAKRALLLAISHELRSPLTRARLHAELLPEDGEAAASRAALLRDLQEMATLVGDLLESERLAGRHARLEREPTDVAALAQEVVAALLPRHPAAAALRVKAEALTGPVDVDPTRLRLLLRNLLDNALRHAAEAQQPPELRLEPMPGGGLQLSLRDHGPGLPPAQIQSLAQAFYRPDSARSRHAGGVGLGLYLCRLVAEAHGGQLHIAAADPGLRVSARLPAGMPAGSPASLLGA